MSECHVVMNRQSIQFLSITSVGRIGGPLCRGDARENARKRNVTSRACVNENAAHERLHLPIFAIGRKRCHFLHERHCENANGKSKESRKGRERHDGQHVCGAARAKEHQGIPPEIPELGMEFAEHTNITPFLLHDNKGPRLFFIFHLYGVGRVCGILRA